MDDGGKVALLVCAYALSFGLRLLAGTCPSPGSSMVTDCVEDRPGGSGPRCGLGLGICGSCVGVYENVPASISFLMLADMRPGSSMTVGRPCGFGGGGPCTT